MDDRRDGRTRVVVVGAGFGGLAVARSLRDGAVDVTVVDRHTFHTFLPLLYQVATSGLNAADVAHPIRAAVGRQPNVSVRNGTVVGIDPEHRHVLLEDQAPLAYDHVVLAVGSAPADFGVPGVAEHGFPLYALEDATQLRNHVLECFERADRDASAIDEGVLTFAIVGGGPTGVELAGALAELFDKVLRHDFPQLPVARARVVLLEMADSLLTPFGERSRRHAIDALRQRGVEVRLQTRVEAVHADRIELAGGEVLPAATLVWAAGVRAAPLAAALGVATGPGGRIAVAPDLSIPGLPGVWAIGDVAHTAGATADGMPAPQLAPAAIQAGHLVAANIIATEAGTSTAPFTYRDKGTMATIGRRSAVAEVPGLPTLVGSVAWLAWLLLHLVMLIGFRNRLSVLVNWAWNYLTWDRGPRIVFNPGRAPDRPGSR